MDMPRLPAQQPAAGVATTTMLSDFLAAASNVAARLSAVLDLPTNQRPTLDELGSALARLETAAMNLAGLAEELRIQLCDTQRRKDAEVWATKDGQGEDR